MEFRKKFMFAITIGILTLLTMHSNVFATTLSDFQSAFKEVAYAYYMRGPSIQYNSMKGNPSWFSPEEATSQNTNYLVCSAYTKNVYKDLLGIKIPPYTDSLLEYAKTNLGKREVIAYGSRDKNNNLVMKFYDKNSENNYITITNPTTDQLLQYLKCGDVITYTGHAMIVYDLKYDEAGNVTDAYVIESGHGKGGYNAITKMPELISIGKNITFGSANPHYLYHNSRNNTSFKDGLLEGSLHLSTLKNVSVWKNLKSSSRKEYSVLRFVDVVDENSENVRLNYNGTKYSDKNHVNESISLPKSSLGRIKYSRLYIEKTVDAHNDNVVNTGDILTYKIVVKNNSKNAYTDDIIITENLSNYVTYKSYSSNKKNTTMTKSNNKIKFNIGKLASGQEVVVTYTVTVKENYVGSVIESTGTVASIPSSVIRNTIGTNLTKAQENAIKEKYESLKNSYTEKELVNEIYKQALGIDLKLNEFIITDLIQNVTPTSTTSTSNLLNTKNNYYNAVLNKYWNTLVVKKYKYNGTDIYAYDMKLWGPYNNKDRKADTIYEENFKTGDILIYTNANDVTYKYSNNKLTTTPVTYENGEYSYIYIEGKGFVGVNLGNDNIRGTKDDRNIYNAKYYSDNGLKVYSNKSETNKEILEFMNYQTLLGKDYYVILRPSLAFDIVPMELDVNYSTTNPTQEDVIVTILSNEEMCKVSGWTLSQDKKTLSKTFAKNAKETLKVYDYSGNEKTVVIKIENIDKTKPVLDINYSTTQPTTESVSVTITSNEGLKTVNGWNLSTDKKVLTKKFNKNTNEVVTIFDLVGNSTTAKIDITNITDIKPNTDGQKVPNNPITPKPDSEDNAQKTPVASTESEVSEQKTPVAPKVEKNESDTNDKKYPIEENAIVKEPLQNSEKNLSLGLIISGAFILLITIVYILIKYKK